MRTISSVLTIAILIILVACSEENEPVAVVDANDFEVTIPENPQNGESLGFIEATTTIGSLDYNLQEVNPSNALSMNSSTGELFVEDASLFDFETNPTITASVLVSAEGQTDRASIIVNLTDVEESEQEEDTTTNEPSFTIWDGPTIRFSKADDADPTLESNQDRITSSVWITRGNAGGQIYNAAMEASPNQELSPMGTEWAEGTLDEIESLTFQPFRAAVGAPRSVVGKALVMHIIQEDVYLSVTFTSWSRQRGGGFAYERSTP
jgi:hypothetical protein